MGGPPTLGRQGACILPPTPPPLSPPLRSVNIPLCLRTYPYVGILKDCLVLDLRALNGNLLPYFALLRLSYCRVCPTRYSLLSLHDVLRCASLRFPILASSVVHRRNLGTHQ